MPVFTNTSHQLFLKAHPVLVWFLEIAEAVQERGSLTQSLDPPEAMWEWGMYLQDFWKLKRLCENGVVLLGGLWKLCKRAMLWPLQPPKNVWDRVCFGGCRGCWRAFSEADSRMKPWWNPDQLQVGCRGLSLNRTSEAVYSRSWGQSWAVGGIAMFPEVFTFWKMVRGGLFEW